MKSITEKMEYLQEKILEPKFSENQGLGNEVGFYIFDYAPEEELKVREQIFFIKDYVEKQSDLLKVQIFDLYDIMIQFFELRGYLEKNFEIEKRWGTEVLFQRMRKALKIATAQDVFVQYIRENLDEEAIIFIVGIGKVFPILRSHILLNNLQIVVEKSPLILFYPGTYDNNYLRLFNEFQDDHYYRAFRMIES
ncbi:DUF1788 domain-containing protein [Isobaculum melis]|uniref:DUF1788 domain-containing protein n=1 Tax=Isobaculum melis TaxID=142588 RepID=A0A1H9RM12_9LACT|nr:DUF1788 domain-containing protein [Isobaculum melis]SER73820.1 protein of unknown function [Isobaculum melis]